MPNYHNSVDQIFHALSDPTRRAVVERLSYGPAAVTELAKPFNMALPSFVQHIGVLETCGVVTSSKSGRIRTVSLSKQAMTTAESWLETQRTIWEKRLDQLDSYLLKLKENSSE